MNDHRAIREADSSTDGVVARRLRSPDLRVQYQSFGNVGKQIAATIGWSAGYLALHPSRVCPDPGDWRAVHYDRVRLWFRRRGGQRISTVASVSPGACDGVEVPRPEVLEGTGFQPSCAMKTAEGGGQGTDGLWINLMTRASRYLPAEEPASPNGPEISLAGRRPAIRRGILSLIVTPAAGHTMTCNIGIGRDPTVAQAVLESIS